MTYDSTFDQTRLDQLAQQHLGGTDISGRILFFGEPEENPRRTDWIWQPGCYK